MKTAEQCADEICRMYPADVYSSTLVHSMLCLSFSEGVVAGTEKTGDAMMALLDKAFEKYLGKPREMLGG